MQAEEDEAQVIQPAQPSVVTVANTPAKYKIMFNMMYWCNENLITFSQETESSTEVNPDKSGANASKRGWSSSDPTCPIIHGHCW